MENDVAQFVLQKNPPIAEGRVGMPGKGEHSRKQGMPGEMVRVWDVGKREHSRNIWGSEPTKQV